MDRECQLVALVCVEAFIFAMPPGEEHWQNVEADEAGWHFELTCVWCVSLWVEEHADLVMRSCEKKEK